MNGIRNIYFCDDGHCDSCYLSLIVSNGKSMAMETRVIGKNHSGESIEKNDK